MMSLYMRKSFRCQCLSLLLGLFQHFLFSWSLVYLMTRFVLFIVCQFNRKEKEKENLIGLDEKRHYIKIHMKEVVQIFLWPILLLLLFVCLRLLFSISKCYFAGFSFKSKYACHFCCVSMVIVMRIVCFFFFQFV